MVHLTQWTDSPEEQWHQEDNMIKMYHYYRDTTLTTCSQTQSVKAGEAFRAWLKNEGIRFDFVGASTLIRTFQTAYYQLLANPKDWTAIFSQEMLKHRGVPRVSQLPLLNEWSERWGYSADNMPMSADAQKNRLRSSLGAGAERHLDTSHLGNFTQEQRTSNNWEAFKELVLGMTVMPYVLHRRGLNLSAQIAKNGDIFSQKEWDKIARADAGSGTVHPIVNIAMASHSGIIMDICKFADLGTPNNGVVELLLLVEDSGDGSELIVRQQEEPCKFVMGAPDPPTELVADDVASCKDPFKYWWAFTGHRVGDRTKCEQAAFEANAYPTYPASKFGTDESLSQASLHV
jgi:hypothetical protein